MGNIEEVRKNIDKLDEEIVSLLIKRADFVAKAAKYKPTFKDVAIATRIDDVLEKVRKTAGKDKEDLIEKIYRTMIDAFIDFESDIWREQNK